MYGLREIKSINNKASKLPIEVLDSVGIGSIEEIPYAPNPEGFLRSGDSVSVSVGPSFDSPQTLPEVRKWIRETGAKYIAFVSKGSLTGKLQAFERVPA